MEVLSSVLNLSIGIVIRVINVFVVKDDALFIGMGVDVVQVDGELAE